MVLKLCFGNFKTEQGYGKDFFFGLTLPNKSMGDKQFFKLTGKKKQSVFYQYFYYFKCRLERNMEMGMDGVAIPVVKAA